MHAIVLPVLGRHSMNYFLANLCALYVHISWGLIAPMAALLAARIPNFHWTTLFFINWIGASVIGLVLLLRYGFAPIRVLFSLAWFQAWPAMVVGPIWPSGGLVIGLAYMLAGPARTAVPNAVAGTYIVFASPIVLQLLGLQILSPLQKIGMIGTFFCMLLAIFG